MHYGRVILKTGKVNKQSPTILINFPKAKADQNKPQDSQKNAKYNKSKQNPKPEHQGKKKTKQNQFTTKSAVMFPFWDVQGGCVISV